MDREKQIQKEVNATFILFIICFAWHVGFGWGLNGVPVFFAGLPLWWWLSVPGVFVIAVAGVCFLVKKVFVNFELDGEDE